MAEIRLTPQQQTAVDDRGGSLLVSASAGSGKTKVLVERLFSYLERERCRVDDFLIITYTRAAAAELRSKIAAELSRRVADRPEDTHLRRQMFRVYQADIRTVDAFCANLLRENIHLLPAVEGRSLTPDFRVLDQQEAELLRARVLQQVLEDFYQRLEQGDGRCELLAETLGAGRDDRNLETLVLELHGKIQSHPFPIRWLHRVAEMWEALPADLADSAYGRIIMDDTVRRASFWAERLRREAADLADVPYIQERYAPAFLAAADSLDRYDVAAREGWDAMAAVAPAFESLKPVSGAEYAARKETAGAVWNRCKKDIKEQTAVYRVTSAEHLADLHRMAPAMLALIELTERFALAYRAEKVRRNCMDFPDQEHWAIELLAGEDGSPTELARQIAGRYREVMVDEYQDTNEVQNCIFRAISGQERHLFAVGDVKQSIYRFRLADPTIFLRKYLAYRDAAEAEEDEPRKVLLQSNFRSRRQILDAANFVFAGIMSVQAGEMEYGPDEALRFGADYYLPRTDTDTEFHLISVADTEEETFDRSEVEARFIAGRIRRMLDEGYGVQDGETLRPVRPEDIVILMRSPSGREGLFAAAMAREGIPFAGEEDEAFFSAMEVAVMLSFLRIIDNPRQDVPLIAVLRSPLFGFTPDDLARIRALQSAGDFYGALCLDETPKTAAFLASLEELRQAARDLSADRLLWKIYSDCHALAVFGAMSGGQQRKNNLIALFTYAGQQAELGRGNLFDFNTYVQDLLERDSVPPISARQSGGGVRLMSIHKSKGLEFPVVILADLQKQFNMKDLNRPVLVHPELGLGTECVDLERRIRYESVSKTALAMTLRRESLAEEMRILYVAMTRAREKLILVDCMSHAQKRVGDLAALTAYPADPEVVNAAKCPGDWLLLPLLCAAEAEPIRRWAEVEMTPSVSLEGWKIRVWENPVPEIPERNGETVADDVTDFDPVLLERRYGHDRATVIPTKVTATQLKGREKDAEIAEGAPPPHRAPSFEMPRFMQRERKLTAAERGTAMHLVMQYLDFSVSGREAVAEQVASLGSRRLVTPEQAEAVDCAAIADFLASPLAGRINAAEKVWREYRFALLMPATIYDGAASDEEMLLQGVADCVFDTPSGLVIVDFKTDRIRPGEEETRAETYRPQLEAYAAALSRVLERPVAEKLLYFFATGQQFAV